MKKQKLKQFLMESGVLDNGDPKEIAAAKKAFRKQYLKQRSQEYRNKHKSVALWFLKTEITRLEKEAASRKIKLPVYLKECIDAYRTKSFILPEDHEIRQLEMALQNVGNEINRIASVLRIEGISAADVMVDVQRQLEKVEELFTALFYQPPEIGEEVQKAIMANPSVAPVLLQIITNYLQHQSNVHQNTSA